MNDGSYLGDIKTAVLGTSQKGSEQMVVTFDITRVWLDEQWRDMPTAERSLYLSMSPKAIDFTRRKLRALGFNSDFDEPQFTKGTQVQLRCTHEEYAGRNVERWEMADWGRREIKRASLDKVAAVKARWLAVAPADPPPPAASPAPPPASASVMPAPPPMATTEAPKASRESAWAQLNATWGDKKTADEMQAIWGELIESRGKSEPDFDEADWLDVLEGAKVPY